MSARWLTTEQVAEMIQVDVQTVRGYCRKGQLRSVFLPNGRERRIPVEAINEMFGISDTVVDIRPHLQVQQSQRRREA